MILGTNLLKLFRIAVIKWKSHSSVSKTHISWKLSSTLIKIKSMDVELSELL